MSGPSDSKQLHIQSARLFNLLVILPAIVENFIICDRSVGYVNIFRKYINMFKKHLMHKADVTLKFIRLHSVILIQIKCNDALKAERLLSVKPDQFTVNLKWCGSYRQAQ